MDVDCKKQAEELIEEKFKNSVELSLVESPESEPTHPDRTIGVSRDCHPSQFLDLMIQKKVDHVCQLSHPAAPLGLNTAAGMLSDNQAFFDFPISSLLSPGERSAECEQELTQFEMKVSSSKGKRESLQKMEESVRSMSPSPSLNTEILSSADELYTNVIFNAPYSPSGKNLNVDRFQNHIELSPQDSGRILIGKKDSLILLVCEDPFGSLDPTALLKKISNCYRSQLNKQINHGAGGAGIGSFMVFESGLSYIVGVIPGKKTIVCSLFSTDLRQLKRRQASKNCHLIHGKP